MAAPRKPRTKPGRFVYSFDGIEFHPDRFLTLAEALEAADSASNGRRPVWIGRAVRTPVADFVAGIANLADSLVEQISEHISNEFDSGLAEDFEREMDWNGKRFQSFERDLERLLARHLRGTIVSTLFEVKDIRKHDNQTPDGTA